MMVSCKYAKKIYQICLSDGITGQKLLNLTLYTKGQQIFNKSIKIHDPILINSFEEIKNANQTVSAFFNDVRFLNVLDYLKSILLGIKLKDQQQQHKNNRSKLTLQVI